MKRYIWAFAVLSALATGASAAELLNVSYDPTRELYTQLNEKFIADWKTKTGETVTIKQSHGGSSAQSRKIIDGLEADVATLGIASDIDILADKAGLLPADWQGRLPGDSTPYNSTIVLLVRKGNPKGIKDWGDLVKSGIKVITPNPKTSAGARWNFLAAWAYALKQNGGDEAKAREWIGALYKNVPVLDTGARGSTVTFAQRGLGDVLIAWENEAYLAISEFGEGKFDIVVPATSILAQPPVAVIDKNAKKHGTEKLAEAYLKFLYTPEAQEIIAKNHYRPLDSGVAAKYASSFPKIDLTTIAQFGGWKTAQPKFFGDGGVFDQIYDKK
ncbi:MAG: sulfate ABC transporter substrate-binding protein [Rudaea sp.]|uniref:sulfate ABC transporter substrate-binding protein n=1 Tax=unclassified Rudaea TaxID=2627037 RepID=UPI0014855B0A|nr:MULTISPECIES: sulfate ABC transporter substrate-binding protein [unclassified Rudaea]MBN8886557.1 sulfate ABC transporter substrate-binding protein [Rudaea sp.]MBR0343920.1 sulfate ABC transporter substrate-binding protein [Rudaea sp.]